MTFYLKLFSWHLFMYIESKTDWAKKSILHFSRWLCYQRPSLEWQVQKGLELELTRLIDFGSGGWRGGFGLFGGSTYETP